MPRQKVSLGTLWDSATTAEGIFQPELISGLPQPAISYLGHAIAPGTPLATAVRLKMHGEIKLKGWQSFQAEQVICWQQGMLWQATVWMNGLPIVGSDRLVNGTGAMQWKLLGLLPVMKAAGPDITRSAVGRMQGEYVWLPSAFLHSAVSWSAPDKTHLHADLSFLDETTHLKLSLGLSGQLQAASFNRWGDPDSGGTPHYENFGVFVDAEETFSGYTIPTKIRAGWYFGSHRFESEGEFFRATITQAIYR